MGLELFPASYVFPQIETMAPFLLQLKAPRAWLLGLSGEPLLQAPLSLAANSERRPGKSLHPLHAEELHPGTRQEVEAGQQGRQPAPFTLAFLLSQPARCRWRHPCPPPQAPDTVLALGPPVLFYVPCAPAKGNHLVFPDDSRASPEQALPMPVLCLLKS